ncbi:Na+/H+ antiporter NhaA [Arthrobacter sp. TMN-37]
MSTTPSPPPGPSSDATAKRVFTRASYPEHLRISSILRKETVGGALLLLGTALALILANSPAADRYFALRDAKFGYEPLHLELSVGAWAADGLLAIFFFLAGLELKREFIAGDLRRFDRAIVPVAAAVGGVVVPALIYVGVILGSGSEALRGWAIPTATDIAFALAVLAVVGSHLPGALRIFLLTLAVVDDLIAIGIIAFFYSGTIAAAPLLLAALPLALYAFLAHRFSRFFQHHAMAPWLILLPLGFLVWALVHASGVHATVAGVLLGFAVPVRPPRKARPGGSAVPDAEGLADTMEHRLRPLSAGVAVPVFAFFSAGVAIGGAEGFLGAITDPVAVGIVLALVVGKPIGILLAVWLVTKAEKANLDPDLSWVDIAGAALLAGVGFTVSLLIAELGFGQGTAEDDTAKVAVLAGSLVAALAAAVVLRFRNRHYRQIAAKEAVDADRDGVPDVFEER